MIEDLNKGYRLEMASPIEVGLLKNGFGVRTWYRSEFGKEAPTMEHPLVKRAVEIEERAAALAKDGGE